MLSSLDDKNDATLIYVCNIYEIGARRQLSFSDLRERWKRGGTASLSKVKKKKSPTNPYRTCAVTISRQPLGLEKNGYST